MRVIISFKEEPSERAHQRLIAAGAVPCGQSYCATGQVADMLRIMAIAESEPDHSIVLEGGDYCETQKAQEAQGTTQSHRQGLPQQYAPLPVEAKRLELGLWQTAQKRVRFPG